MAGMMRHCKACENIFSSFKWLRNTQTLIFFAELSLSSGQYLNVAFSTCFDVFLFYKMIKCVKSSPD